VGLRPSGGRDAGGRHPLSVAPVGDPAALAAHCLALLRQPELAHRLSVAGRRRAEAYAWEAVLPQWAQVLNLTAGSPSGMP
jgi:glycosyltransferase involved in cell wall biosynthesis